MRIYKAHILYTPTREAFEVIENGYVAVEENGLIEGVYAQLPQRLSGCRMIDFGNRLLIPAMNDLHLHAPQYRNMGMAMDLRLLEWLETYTFPEESRFADIHYAERVYQRFVHELWMQGTMRSAIFATIHPEATTLLADLIRQSGMGAYVGLVGMNRNCPEYLSNTTEQLIGDIEGLIRHLSNDQEDKMDNQTTLPPLVRPIITPRFVPTCSDDMLNALGHLAKQYGLPVQSHLSENPSEIAWVKELKPEALNYGDAYYRHGLLGQTPTLMAHCCYTEGPELELLRQQGVYAVHCPTSNDNLASGMAHIRRLLDSGVRVALGTDISGGNNMSMLRVIQYTLQVSKLLHAETDGKERFLSLSEAFWLATKSGGSFFGKVGSFEPGYEFDALVIDDGYLNGFDYSLLNRIERYVYLGDDRDIKHRFCRGRELPEPRLTW